MGRFVNYAIETRSDAIIYIPSFIKIGSGIQKLLGEIHIQSDRHTHTHTHTHTEEGDLISLLLVFQNKESRLEKVIVAFRMVVLPKNINHASFESDCQAGDKISRE
jgi:hypothetical protein